MRIFALEVLFAVGIFSMPAVGSEQVRQDNAPLPQFMPAKARAGLANTRLAADETRKAAEEAQRQIFRRSGVVASECRNRSRELGTCSVHCRRSPNGRANFGARRSAASAAVLGFQQAEKHACKGGEIERIAIPVCEVRCTLSARVVRRCAGEGHDARLGPRRETRLANRRHRDADKPRILALSAPSHCRDAVQI